MPYKNAADRKKYHDRYYAENKETYRAHRKRYREDNKAANRLFVDRYKRFCGCSRCGYREHAVVLDLHHVQPKKETIARLMTEPRKTLKAEMRKCVVLCANCHRVVHYCEVA